MADAQLQVVIKARNDAKKAFNELGGQVKGLQGSTGFGGLNDKISAFGDKFKSLTGVSLGFATAAGAASGAVMALGKFLADSVNETVAYATEIDNMSRLLGISTEDTSRLVQASDDLFISQEKLQGALEAASRKGIDVSIDGLKKLSTEYLSMNDASERAKFLADNFGRSGFEMGKLMEQGAEGIDAATSAIADNMVITQQSMQEIIHYKQSVDNLNDSWQGVKYSIGSEIIPQLDLLMRAMTAGKDDVELHTQEVNRLELQYERAASAAAIGSESAKKSMEELAAKIAWLTGEYETGEAGVSDFYAGISNSIPVTQGATTEIGNLGAGLSTVTGYFNDMTEAMLFNKLAANMTESAALALGVQMGLVDPMTYSLSLKIDDLTDKYDANKDGILTNTEMTKDYYDEVKKMQDLVNGLQDKTITVTVVTNSYGGEGGGIGGAELMAGVDLNGNGIIGAAQGANFTVPPGFPNDSLLMGVSSGEHVNVTPAPNKGSGNTTIVFNYSPALSLSDRAEFEGRVIPMMKRLMAKAG